MTTLSYQDCKSATVLVLIFAALAGTSAAFARSEHQIDIQVRLPEHEPVKLNDNVDEGPFALLAAFPEVVKQVHVTGEKAHALISTGTTTGSKMPMDGNPLAPGIGILSSAFGMRHHPVLGGWRHHDGIDLAAAAGTPVYATADGVVDAAGRRGGYGLSVTIEHTHGFETRFGHMSRLNVTRGARVRRGDVIGWVGSTGLSTGPHLHYETRVNGKAVDPMLSLNRNSARNAAWRSEMAKR